MLQAVTIELPRPTFERLRTVAEQNQQTIPDVVDALVTQMKQPPSLQNTVEQEMAALAGLPDEILLLVVQNPMPQEYQEELAMLNDEMQRTGQLSTQAQARQAYLSMYYQNAILRRSYCLELLRRHGYNLSNILQMPSEPVI